MSKSNEETSQLEEAISRAFQYLEDEDISPDADRYAQVVDQLTKLHALRPKPEPHVSLETLIPVVGNLLGIFSILGYERANVVTSKALGFVFKPRI